MQHIKRVGDFLCDELLYAGHLQSAGATGLAVFAMLLSFDTVHMGIAVSTYFLFQSVYYFDRFLWLAIDEISNSVRSRHLWKYHRYRYPLIVLCTLAALAVPVWSDEPFFSVFVSIVLAGGFAYPLFVKYLTRHIPLFKDIYVAAVFGAVPLGVVAFGSAGADAMSSALVLSASAVFVGMCIIQCLLDFKDVAADANEKLLTLPVMLGTDRARRLLGITTWGAGFLLVCAALSINAFIAAFTTGGVFVYTAILLLGSVRASRTALLAAAAPLVWAAVGIIVVVTA